MSNEISSFYNGSSLQGTLEELQVVKAIGRAPSASVGELVQLINKTAIEKLQGMAEKERSSQKITLEDYNWIQVGFKKLEDSAKLKEKVISLLKTHDVEGLRQILDQHKEQPSDPVFAKILFSGCTSLDIATLLVERGLAVKHIDKDTIEEIFWGLFKLFHNKSRQWLALIDIYAKAGLEPLVEIIDFQGLQTIEVLGIRPVIARNTLLYYPEYPHIKAACHKFILSEFNPKIQKNVEVILKHCSKYGDSEGLDLILQEAQKRLASEKQQAEMSFEDICIQAALYAIGHNQAACVEAILKNFPHDQFSIQNKIRLESEAKKMGFVQIEELLASPGMMPPTYIQQHQAWWRGQAEKLCPALNGYTLLNRFLNQQHLYVYGGNSVQDIFKQEQRNSIIHTLWVIHEFKNTLAFSKTCTSTLLPSQYFRELLLALGQRRQNTAMKCSTQNVEIYGSPREEDLYLRLNDGAYNEYAERIHDNFDITIAIDNQTFVLSKVYTESYKIVYDDKVVKNTYIYFWDNKDPVFSLVSGVFENLVRDNFATAEELGKEIARFHWIMAHISPFGRGSASITEVLTDALWLFHGYIPQPIEAGKSLDLEALVEPKLEKYQAIYPLGKKYTQSN